MAPKKSIDCVYYFPVNGRGEEVEMPVLIDLREDDSANLSRLPVFLRARLERFGVPDELRRGSIHAKDGGRFLEALLRSTTGYERYRSNSLRVGAAHIN